MKINEIPELTEKQAFLVYAFNLASGVQIEMKTRAKFIRYKLNLLDTRPSEKSWRGIWAGTGGEKQKE